MDTLEAILTRCVTAKLKGDKLVHVPYEEWMQIRDTWTGVYPGWHTAERLAHLVREHMERMKHDQAKPANEA